VIVGATATTLNPTDDSTSQEGATSGMRQERKASGIRDGAAAAVDRARARGRRIDHVHVYLSIAR